jgi:3-methyladenine DNA glycosylase/8-oxoguanine DNA glycosylase
MVNLEPIESTEDVFFDLVSCISDQQIHYRSKGSYLKKVIDLLGGAAPTPERLLTLTREEFIHKKISGIKFNALTNLADYWINN